MSDELIHSFRIPHEKIIPHGDTILVKVPSASKKAGSLYLPDQWRDLNQTNVMCAKIFKIGPVAFLRKDADGTVNREDVSIGDWVIFRPHAGTYIKNGEIVDVHGWRYLSSHKDVLGYIYEADMPEGADAALEFAEEAKVA